MSADLTNRKKLRRGASTTGNGPETILTGSGKVYFIYSLEVKYAGYFVFANLMLPCVLLFSSKSVLTSMLTYIGPLATHFIIG